MQTVGYAAFDPTSPLRAWQFTRREVGEKDVQIDILYCGICHSDIHTVRNEWEGAKYPIVPGHEIVGKVSKVGAKVTKVKVGDLAGVGCMVNSCQDCSTCRGHEEQFCERGGPSFTYNSVERDSNKTPTQGGYSRHIVLDEHFTLRIPNKFSSNLAAVAPLLCAGITVYSPMANFKHAVGPGKHVAINGLGGLGHMGVKYAAAFGAEVTVLSTSASKEADAKRLGAHHFIISKDKEAMEKAKNTFDFILDTVSAPHEITPLITALRTHGILAVVGAPSEPFKLKSFGIIFGNKIVAGSLIGGIKQTQEMLDFSADKGIVSDIELIGIDKVNEAYERTIKADVKYRFVIDVSTIKI